MFHYVLMVKGLEVRLPQAHEENTQKTCWFFWNQMERGWNEYQLKKKLHNGCSVQAKWCAYFDWKLGKNVSDIHFYTCSIIGVDFLFLALLISTLTFIEKKKLTWHLGRFLKQNIFRSRWLFSPHSGYRSEYICSTFAAGCRKETEKVLH